MLKIARKMIAGAGKLIMLLAGLMLTVFVYELMRAVWRHGGGSDWQGRMPFRSLSNQERKNRGDCCSGGGGRAWGDEPMRGVMRRLFSFGRAG